jgi:hypothetical protein
MPYHGDGLPKIECGPEHAPMIAIEQAAMKAMRAWWIQSPVFFKLSAQAFRKDFEQ